MDNETPAYVNRLKQAAFRHGLALPMLSIHQDFVSPEAAEREAVDHTKQCIALAARLGIPAIRLNSGRWNTIESFDALMKVKGNEPPIQGYTDEDAFKWCIDSINACLPDAEANGIVLALETTGA
jgi:sugar phosphate isomerase/epimerase